MVEMEEDRITVLYILDQIAAIVHVYTSHIFLRASSFRS